MQFVQLELKQIEAPPTMLRKTLLKTIDVFVKAAESDAKLGTQNDRFRRLNICQN
jgi:hypothetical protein